MTGFFSQNHHSCHGVWSYCVGDMWLRRLWVTISWGNQSAFVFFVSVALFYFSEHPILCKFSDSPSHLSGRADKADLRLYDSVSQDSVRCLLVGLPCSGSLSLLGFHKFPGFFTVNVLMTSYLCSWPGYFYGSGTLDSHCVQSWTSLENWSRFLHICIFGADLSLTINSMLNIADSFRASGFQADPAVCLASVYSKCLSTAQKTDCLTLSGMLSVWRRAAPSSCCCLIIICYLLSLLQNLCKISSGNWAGSRPCLHYAEAEP